MNKHLPVKIVAVLTWLFAISGVCVPNVAKAQNLPNTTIKLDSKTVTVADFFSAIEKQANCFVVYSETQLDPKSTVSFAKTSASLPALLEEFSTKTNVKYKFSKNYITFSPAPVMAVNGVITDEKGETLSGATVNIKGTTVWTVSDLDGKYSIKAAQGDVLEASFIGYRTQEVTVSSSSVNIKMDLDQNVLDEVVFIGYGTRKKRDLTGSISSVNAEKIQQEAPRSVEDVLKGGVAGVTMSMGKSVSGEQSMQIRGINTLSAESTPLVVLDGVVYNGAMTDINPSDIETIDVLKDASSVAIYGAKAASGVIAITTKRGVEGKPVVNFDVNIGLAQASRMAQAFDGEEC